MTRKVDRRMTAGLTLQSISKSFGTTRVLDKVSLDVQPGEFISLVGPSGCGKSTLLRIIAGLEFQDHGQVSIGQQAVDHLSPRARNIAMVFQSYALYPHMSVFDNIALPLSMARLALLERLPLVRHLSPRRGRISGDIATAVRAVAAQLKIESLLDRKPGQLSGGQRQRVALARAMVRQPTLFLMDEPLSNLDAQLRVHMRDELSELHSRLGATFIYVTHDQVEAMTMSDRVAMMDGGHLVQVGKPSELYERPATLAVARFIGSPAINVLEAKTDSSGRIILRDQHLAAKVSGLLNQSVSIGIRPEAVSLKSAGTSRLAARVRRNEHHGAERLIYVDLEGADDISLISRIANASEHGPELSVGDTVSVALDAKRMHVFDASGRRAAMTTTNETGEIAAMPRVPARAIA